MATLEAAAEENAGACQKLDERLDSIARMRAADLAESEAARVLLAGVAQLHDLCLGGSPPAIESSFRAGCLARPAQPVARRSGIGIGSGFCRRNSTSTPGISRNRRGKSGVGRTAKAPSP